jgi:hypothetical protein
MVYVNGTSALLSGSQWHFDRAHGSWLADIAVFRLERPKIDNKRRGTQENESDAGFSPVVTSRWLLRCRRSTSQIDEVTMFLERDRLTRRQKPSRQPRYDFSKTRLSWGLVFVGSIADGWPQDAGDRNH